MTFKQLQETFRQEFGITKLADIARELAVTPQVVSNWKSKNQLPYKYVKKLNKKINKKNSSKKMRFEKPIALFSSEQFSNKGSEDEKNDNVSIYEILNQLYHLSVKNIYIIIFIPLIVAISSAIYILYYVPNKYEAHFKIIPTSSNQSSLPQSLTGIAGQLNVGSADLKSGKYFPDIIMSRNMLIKLLDRKFVIKNVASEGKTLFSILTGLPSETKVKSSNQKKVAGAINKIKKSIKVRTKKTNLITQIACISNDPELSHKIGTELIDLLNEILRKFEEDRIKLKKEFISKRILEEQINLAKLEDKLKDFREKNREIRRSPALQLVEARLKRDVQVKTQVYITLKQQNEMTQINSYDNASFVHMIDSSGIPIKRKSPERSKFVIIFYIFGLIITYFYIVARDYYPTLRESIKFPS